MRLQLCAVLLALAAGVADATVVLMTANNESFAFDDADAAFGAIIPTSGMRGVLRRAIPYDACEPLENTVDPRLGVPEFALVQRGGCQFDVKVLNAQMAGFQAAVIYNDEDSGALITMSGRHLFDIVIPAVFVTMASGLQLLALLGQRETVCFLLPSFDSAAWSIMTASFLSLLAVSAVLTCFMYVRRRRLRQLHGMRGILDREPPGMPAREVLALPQVAFCAAEDCCAGLETCAICLEDYEQGDRVRLLPCKHGFHVDCVDKWLLTRRPVCPVCKRDAKDPGLGSAAAGADVEAVAGSESARRDRWRTIFPQFFIVPRRLRLPLWLSTDSGALQAPLLSVAVTQAEEGHVDAPAQPEASAEPSEDDSSRP